MGWYWMEFIIRECFGKVIVFVVEGERYKLNYRGKVDIGGWVFESIVEGLCVRDKL